MSSVSPSLPRHLEEALRASEESYRTIFDSSNDAIFVHDLATGAILDANRMACQLSGVSREELLARGIDIISGGPPPYTAELALDYIQRASAGEPQRFEWCSTHPHTGEEVWVEVSLQRVVIRGEERLLALVRDIRERKMAERALVASEEAYRTIFQHSSEAIWVHDVETGEMLDVNQAGCDLYGYTFAEMMELGHDALLYPGSEFTVERVAENMGRAIAGETPRFEWMGRHKDGSPVWGEVTLRRVTVSGKDRILATVRDIRERKQAEGALRRANEELERRVAERTAELAATNVALEEEISEHEAAREQLLERTAELEAIFRALPDLFFRTDADGTARDFRVGHGARLALPAEAFLGRRLQTVLPPEVGRQMEEALEKLARSGELVHFEYRLPTPAGECDYEARFVPLGADQVIIVIRDVTERKNAERLVKEREEHFRQLIESSHDLIQTLDREGRVVYTSPSAQRLLGYSPEEIVGSAAPDYIHPDDLPTVQVGISRAMSHPGQIVDIEYRVRHRDGRFRWFHAIARTLSPESAERGLVANARDITGHKQAEEALRNSEEHFRRLIENSSDFIMIVDPTAAISYVAPSVQRILGFTVDEMMGTRPADMVHPDDVPSTMATVEYILTHPGEVVTSEYRVRHKDGSWRVFEGVARTLSPVSGDEGIVANCRDVTERRRTEQALREATEAAERANQAKSEFLSRMSHELRTPMNSILGFAQVLEGAALPERQERCVQHILRAGQHLLQLINEVLEISRIEAGRHNLSLEPVRIRSVLQEALGLARPMAAQARINLEYAAFAQEHEYVHADRQRLSQVLLNLLSNAIKYNRAGGRVRLSCEYAPDAADGTPRLRIRVEDTGRGIPPEKREDLFTPFARLGAEDSGIEGTGLGLALSQRLAEAMGGSLTLERTSGEGSVFSLELRLTSSPLGLLEEEGTTPRSREGVPHAPAKLLYIEDNLANLSLVETILWERPNWRTIPALQGQIGVELAREHLPDLVLLDLHLPDIRGEEVLRRLREDARTAHIPVLVISADATRSATERLLQSGAAGFLTKPLDVAEFLDTVERLLQKPGISDETPLAG